MHPGFFHWWKHHGRHHDGNCGAEANCGHGGDEDRVYEGVRRGWHASGHDDGGGFGVRRPLRFLAYKLELEQAQVAQLAKVLAELKTERAQAQVDDRRAQAQLADAVGGEQFDAAKAAEAGQLRVKTAEKLRDAVKSALSQIHAILNAEQRDKLAYLIRTGVVIL